MNLQDFQHKEDPVVATMPKAWTSEQQQIASDAMRTLKKHYPGWLWQLEFTDPQQATINKPAEMGSLIIRLGDVQTEVVYVVNYRDLDKDRMRIIVKAGGEFLEALGLSRTKWRHDEVTGLPKTAGGIIVPDLNALPEGNPGRDRVKALSKLIKH